MRKLVLLTIAASLALFGCGKDKGGGGGAPAPAPVVTTPNDIQNRCASATYVNGYYYDTNNVRIDCTGNLISGEGVYAYDNQGCATVRPSGQTTYVTFDGTVAKCVTADYYYNRFNYSGPLSTNNPYYVGQPPTYGTVNQYWGGYYGCYSCWYGGGYPYGGYGGGYYYYGPGGGDGEYTAGEAIAWAAGGLALGWLVNQ